MRSSIYRSKYHYETGSEHNASLPRYTPDQIRRNRLKVVLFGSALLTAATFAYDSTMGAERTATVAAVSLQPNQEAEYTDSVDAVPAVATTLPMTPQPARVEAQAITAANFTEGTYVPHGMTPNQRLAHQIAREEYHLPDEQIRCMDYVVNGHNGVPGEAVGYNSTADNPDSTAYGIAQAMLSLHSEGIREDYPDYYEGTIEHPHGGNPGTQIRWMLDYMLEKRGTVCNNWEYKVNHPTHAY